MKDILGFKDEYDWLSNFYPASVKWVNLMFPCVENAFVYAKLAGDPDLSEWEKIKEMTPREAKKYGRQIELRPGWDSIKVKVMQQLVYDKFTRNPELQRKLMATGGAYIEETNWWKDTFWGVCNGKGKNTLGQIIMNTRERIRLEQQFS
jgi:ribA/ribD-fused uncharacterized protein